MTGASRAVVVLSLLTSCRVPHDDVQSADPAMTARAVGQWIWTRADVAVFNTSVTSMPALQAGVFIGSVRCDTTTHRLIAQAGLSPGVVPVARPAAVIRFEDGMFACRSGSDRTGTFHQQLDSAVAILRVRGGNVDYAAVQLDHDVPQRALTDWADAVRYLHAHSLRSDSVWVTSIIAHLREPAYGDLFRDVAAGHILQVFDTGEPATDQQVTEAVRLVQRAGLRFSIGLGAFERRTRRGTTNHRAWFGAVPRFVDVSGYAGVWIFPAGQRWITLYQETK